MSMGGVNLDGIEISKGCRYCGGTGWSKVRILGVNGADDKAKTVCKACAGTGGAVLSAALQLQIRQHHDRLARLEAVVREMIEAAAR